MTIGNHHLEYGFPSTHSTNSVSIAFYVWLWVLSFRQGQDVNTNPITSSAPSLSSLLFNSSSNLSSDVLSGSFGGGGFGTEGFSMGSWLLHSYFYEVVLLFYSFSVVYGRTYAGMHSIVDCLAGCFLGIGVTAFQWVMSDWIEGFFRVEGLIGELMKETFIHLRKTFMGFYHGLSEEKRSNLENIGF